MIRISKLIFMLLIFLTCFSNQARDGHCDSIEETFQKGKRLYDSSRLDEALTVWKPISNDSLFGPVIYLLAASSYISEKKYASAESAIKEFMRLHPSTPYKEIATSILIESQVEQGKTEAQKTIQAELSRASDSEKPPLIFRLVILEIKHGNHAAAENMLRKIMVDYPASVEGLHAYELVPELVKQKKISPIILTENEEQIRANKLFASGKFDLAAESYKRLLQIKPEDKVTKLKLARSLYKNRDNNEAIKVLNSFLSSKVMPEDEIEANYLLSLIYWRLDKDKEFESSCKKILDKGQTKLKKRVLANLAAHNFEKGKLSQAEVFYNQLLTETSSPILKADIKWKLAWIKYRKSQFKEAAGLFAECRKLSANGKLANPSKYWEARSFARAGSKAAAEALYRQLIPSGRNDYYAILAAKELKLNDVGSGSGSKKVDLSETKLTPQQMNLKEVKAALRLLDNDLPQLALANLKTLPKSVRDTPSIALLTATAAHNSKMYGMACDILYDRFGSVVDEPPDTSPRDFLNVAYPKVHFPHTIRQSAIYSIDPYLVWSIMRQESKYDSTAVSPAGAVGLMQVTPSTAQKLEKLKSKNYSGLISHLLEPKNNISIGVEILAQNLKTFNGNIVSAIASYNADPNKVRDWTKRNAKMDQDEFIENIPFLETRLYVKKVLANFYAYKKIHSRKDMAERW